MIPHRAGRTRGGGVGCRLYPQRRQQGPTGETLTLVTTISRCRSSYCPTRVRGGREDQPQVPRHEVEGCWLGVVTHVGN
jgi:hypothetical protein